MPDDVIGMVLNRTYRIERLLAAGGMGAVYLATHVRLPNKRFAIKILKGQVRQREIYIRFRREAEIATQLGHPNIIDVLDFNQMPDGHPYIVMEYLEGETLTGRLRRKVRLSIPELIAILGQVGGGLQAAHEIGVVHRDVKPDNIFLVGALDGPVNCKILDFGVSKIRDSGAALTRVHALIGTTNYMSPEQAAGFTGDIDATTDIFALGTLSYRLLTNRLPFVGLDMGEVLDQVIHYDPDLKPLPPAVRPVVAKALAKAKSARYQRVERFVGDLVQALQGADSIVWVERLHTMVAPATVATMHGSNGDSKPTTATPAGTFPEGGDVDASLPTEIEAVGGADFADLSQTTLAPSRRRGGLLGGAALLAAIGAGVWVVASSVPERPADAPGAVAEVDASALRSASQEVYGASRQGTRDARSVTNDAMPTDVKAADAPTTDASPGRQPPDARLPSTRIPSNSAPEGRRMQPPSVRQQPRKRGRRVKRAGRRDAKRRRKILGDRIPSMEGGDR